MSKSTKDVFEHHVKAFAKHNTAEVMKDFSEDAVYISSSGTVARGLAAIEQIYNTYFNSLASDTVSKVINEIIEGEIVFLEWTSDSSVSSISDGTDTFVIRGGYIVAQTAKYTEVKK